MIWVLLFASTILLGYFIVPLIRFHSLSVRLLIGWYISSLSTGLFLSITTILLPLNSFHVFFVIVIHSTIITFLYPKYGKIKSSITWCGPWPMAYLLAVIGISLKYLSKIYHNAPFEIPYAMRTTVDEELSFINSVLSGCNKQRHTLFFTDPLQSKANFHGYSMPLMYMAGLMASGASYSTASIVVCFMNTLGAAISILFFCSHTCRWSTLAATLSLFSGGWAGFLHFRGSNRMQITNDLVHTISAKHESVMYHVVFHLLSFSKSTSYSIGMAQFAILSLPNVHVAAILAALTPSLTTSLSIYGFLASMPHCSLPKLAPYLLGIVPKLTPFTLCFKPIFREAEMRGTFFAPLAVWFIALGPIFVILLIFGWFAPREKINFYLTAMLGPFFFFQMIREGHDQLANATSFAAISIPIIMVLFTDLLKKFIVWPEDEEYKGATIFMIVGIVIILLFGGFICGRRMISMISTAIDEGVVESAEWLRKIPPKSIILMRHQSLSPVVLTGHQAFLGDSNLLWNRGAKLYEKFDVYEKLTNGSARTEDFAREGIEYVLDDMDNKFPLDQKTFTIVSRNYRYRLLKLLLSIPKNDDKAFIDFE